MPQRPNDPATYGTLSLVAVPIGNPDDITLRALSVLRSADRIIAENPHVTKELLAYHHIETPTISYRPRLDADCDRTVLDLLLAGENLAFVSDAGTPALVDPGQTLIAAAVHLGIPVVPIPGATALIAALVAAGLPTERFLFDGSPPRTRADRHAFFAALAHEPRTIVLYESPAYLRSTLSTLTATLGANRPVVVAFRLTTSAEQFFRGTLTEAVSHFRKPRRGDYALVIAGSLGH